MAYQDNSKEIRFGPGGKVLLDGGLCLNEPSTINPTQSPYMPNMCCDDGGMLIKRPGQTYLYETSLGSGKINGLYADFKGKTIIAWGTALYSQTGNGQPTQIYTGVTNAKAFFFAYNGNLYMINGTDFLKYDGTTVSAVTPYIPKISINRSPNGQSSTVNESWNMIGAGFTDQFIADGTSTVFQLSFTSLDATAVTAVVNGTSMAENSGFTVNRTTGAVTFSTAPTKNDLNPNNVLITAYKTFASKPLVIKKCTKAIEFSARMFFTGNPDSPNYYYASGITDAWDCSYFPEKYQYAVRGADKKVTGFCISNNRLVIFKEDLTISVYASIGLDNTASFPYTYLNTEIGCDIPDSIQLINDVPVFANTYSGVYVITSTLIAEEKAFKLVSNNINGNLSSPGLLQEALTELKGAISVDHGGKYYLVISNHAYIWNYQKSFNINSPESLIWFYYTNINASCFMIRENILMYGHNANGLICKFSNVSADFGAAINATWKSKLFDFEYPDWTKDVLTMWLTTKANSASQISINYYNDRDGKIEEEAIISSTRLKSFSWAEFAWNTLSWSVQIFSPTKMLKLRQRKIRYFQIEITNNETNENLSIIGIALKYKLRKKVK